MRPTLILNKLIIFISVYVMFVYQWTQTNNIIQQLCRFCFHSGSISPINECILIQILCITISKTIYFVLCARHKFINLNLTAIARQPKMEMRIFDLGCLCVGCWCESAWSQKDVEDHANELWRSKMNRNEKLKKKNNSHNQTKNRLSDAGQCALSGCSMLVRSGHS